jgi:sulfite reductase (ferredoxin)
MYKLPDTLSEDIVKFARLARDYREGRVESVQFKAFRVPMGIYEQRRNEVYMVRIRATGGIVAPAQLLRIIAIARQHRSDWLHITTRQEIQIQNLALEEVAGVLSALQEIGLSSKGGGGNTVRNILVSNGSGIADGEVFDTTPHALALTSKLIAEPDSYLLPRKMKIAFSSDDRQVDYAAVNDLGFVARLVDGRRGFRVYAGGGGGSKPSVGWLLFDFLPEGELFVVAEALKRMFSEHGNRKNKHKARIRYIFYRLGEEAALKLLRDYFEEARLTTPPFVPEEEEDRPAAPYAPLSGLVLDAGYAHWKRRYAIAQRQAGRSSVTVPFVLGNLPLTDQVWVEAVENLLTFVARFGRDTLRFTTTQNIQLRHIPDEALPELYLRLKPIVADISAPLVANHLVSCTGADTCRLGIALSKGLASAIRRSLLRSSLNLDALAALRIHISGCPNSCGQQIWADIGFAGKAMRTDRLYPGYQVYLAARRDDAPRLAEPVGSLSARDVPAFVVRLLTAYEQVHASFASLTAWLETEGRRVAEALLAEYKDVPSFEDDKNYYFDWGADAVFSLADRGAAECSAGLFDMIELDLQAINASRQALEAETDRPQVNRLLREMLHATSRMLLVTRGAEPKTVDDAFALFATHFIDAGLVDSRFRPLIALAQGEPAADFLPFASEVRALAEAVAELYRTMDDSLQFKNIAPAGLQSEAQALPPLPQAVRTKDLRGVACPMNFVLTKIELSTLRSGDRLEIWLDEGAPIRNVPASLRTEGHTVVAQTPTDGYWVVVVEKR